MEWGRRGWLPAAALAVLAAVETRAAELRRLETASTPQGAVVRLALSAPAPADLHEVSGPSGSRVYLDLPRGTRLGRVPRRLPPRGPIASLRLGLAEDGGVRVVLDLEPAATHRLTRERGGRLLALAVVREVPEAAPRPAPAPVPTLRLGSQQPKIVLDPGHGGQDPGARGFAVEKEVTLAIAKRLATLLRERLGAEVVLTRTADATLPLAARTARANAEGADLFLSIHANASPTRRLRGIETYYLNNAADRATIRLAAMENGLDLLTRAPARRRSDLRYILSDLVQVGKMEESIALATAVQRGLVDHLSGRYDGVADLGVKRGPFYVLVGAYMPCVLVEASFLTHPKEGRRLADRAYRETVAEGIQRGVERFLADSRRARTL